MCGLKEFLRVQGTFPKKFLQTHFHIWEKLNLIRCIKALIKEFTPHTLRSTPSPQGRRLKKPFRQATLATVTFMDGKSIAKLILLGKILENKTFNNITYNFLSKMQ